MTPEETLAALVEALTWALRNGHCAPSPEQLAESVVAALDARYRASPPPAGREDARKLCEYEDCEAYAVLGATVCERHKAVASELGLTSWQVTAALKRAREAEYDARCVKALAGRRGFVSLRTTAEVIAADVFEECVTPEGEVHECREAGR
jgi:hypothetical protein